MEGLPQTSHGGHKTESMKPLSGEGSDVLKESRIRFFDDLLVPDGILQDLSFLINDELQALGRILKVPEGSLPKIHTDYGVQQRETTYRMLLDWKKKMGNKATYDVLVEALVDAGREDLACITTDLIRVDEHQLKRWKKQIERKLFDLEEEILMTEEKPLQSESHEKKHQLNIMRNVQRPIDRKLLDLIRKNLMKKERKRFQSGFHEEHHDLKTMKVRTERQLLELKEKTLRLESYSLNPHEYYLKIEKVRFERYLLDLEEKFLTKEREPSTWESNDKLDHFIRCLKAKYTAWFWSLKGTPWMKSEKLHIEDMFVDVGLMFRNPFETKASGASWQTLYGFEAFFTHPVLQSAHVINIEGESGSGKTFLLHRMVDSWCHNDSFTQNGKLFILLPSSRIEVINCATSLYFDIKRFLLPLNSFLTVSDVKNILMNTESVFVLDDFSPDIERLGTKKSIRNTVAAKHYVFNIKGIIEKLVLAGKMQFICPTSVIMESGYGNRFLSTTVMLQKWQKSQHLSYLRKFLPHDEKMHEQILEWIGENSILVDMCGNPLCYALCICLLKGDLIRGRDVIIQNLSQLFEKTFESLAKHTGEKQLESEDESEISLYRKDIIRAAYEHLGSGEWQINSAQIDKSYQMMINVGILVTFSSHRHPLHSTHSVRFCHSAFQIWLAAIYLSECRNFRNEYEQLFFSKSQSRWYRPLTIIDEALLQRFICGLNSEGSVILMEDLAKGMFSDKFNDEHFFLCLNEYCGSDDPLRPIVNVICQRKIEFKLGGSNQPVQKSMVKVLNLASRWKIIIKCIDISKHAIVDVDEQSLTLDNGVRLGIVSAKLLRINNWCGKELANYLSKCLNLEETRIFANDPSKRRHEIQKEVKGMDFKVRWESNYKYEDNGTETEDDETMNLAVLFEDTEEEDEIVNLAHLFENVDMVSGIQPVLNEVLSKEMNVDAKGGRLVIEEAGIRLDVPPGALKEGVNIRIAVVNDKEVIFPGDIPMVTPVVKCKPTGLIFQKPVTLFLPHCGILTDNKDHGVICMQGYISDGYLKWNIDVNSRTTLFKRRCSIELTHFCYRSCSIPDLECKRMRAFVLKKRFKRDVLVKLWICNDDQLVFNNIVNEEQDDGYQKTGSHEEFVLSITLGDVQVSYSGTDKMISLKDIWNVSRRSKLFKVPIGTDFEETLLVKQMAQEDAYGIQFFIDKARSNRRKRKHGTTDSSINKQSCLLISNSKSSSSENVHTTRGRNEVKDFNVNDLVSTSSLENLSGLVGKKWRELGRRLGLSNEELQNIATDHTGYEKEIIYQMLHTWNSKNGQQATYHHLFAALGEVGSKDLIENSTLREKWVNT